VAAPLVINKDGVTLSGCTVLFNRTAHDYAVHVERGYGNGVVVHNVQFIGVTENRRYRVAMWVLARHRHSAVFYAKKLVRKALNRGA